MKILESKTALIIISFLFLDAFLWYSVWASSLVNPKLYFLNVGQGDSQLIRLPGPNGRGIKMLIDGGPGKSVLGELQASLPANDRYIDLLIITHAEADHLDGFIEVLKRYEVGAFIYNGRGKDTVNWATLASELKDKKIPVIIVGEGDRIRYGSELFTFISPGPEFMKSEALNDTGLVSLLLSNGVRTLFTADIDSRVEDFLLDKYDLNIDILKVAHHGSRFSTTQNFLDHTMPKIAVIQVGKSNKYGHPNAEVIQRLVSSGARVFRNDEHGRVVVTLKNGEAEVLRER
ncbi:MAG TPA: MBL fold metallo-hydrolase [Candidatus Paceibacterota bacterium]